jgi:hypothetical protein
MKQFSHFLLMFLILSCFSLNNSKRSDKIHLKDFFPLVGNWEGQLTYLDYSSGKPYTMPANCEIKILKKQKQILVYSIYPDEMEANSVDTIRLSNDGIFLNKEKLVSKTLNSDNELIIVTEESGQDGNDNLNATFHHTYTISNSKFSIRKDVQFIGTSEWIKRHEYVYVKK